MSVHNNGYMPDRLSEAMVATASAYFLPATVQGVESAEDFRRTMHRMYRKWPDEAIGVLAAGMLVAGFEISTDPLLIETPSDPDPEQALDTGLFMFNWYNIAPTLIDMGLQAVSTDSPNFDPDILERARVVMGFGDEGVA